MGVTEFALIKLRCAHDNLEFLESLMQAQEIQDEWVRQNQPHILANKPYNFVSTFFVQKTDPAYLMITAPWDSPEGHGEWIQSKENQSMYGRMAEFITPGSDAVTIFHMNPAGKESDLRGDLFPKGGFNVCRITMSPQQKESANAEYQEIENKVQQLGHGRRTWGGWRIETVDDSEDLVVFWTTSVPEELLSGLLSLPDVKTDVRHFYHVV